MSDQTPPVETFAAMATSGESPALAAMARQVASLMIDPRNKSADQRPVTMTRRQATVTVVNVGPPLTADVVLDGETIPGVSPQSTYRPQVGDQVWLEFHGPEAHVSAPVTSDANHKWHTLTLLGSWVTFSVWAAPLQYHRDAEGWVHLRGTVAGGAFDTDIAVLPAGFRPGIVHSAHSMTVSDAGTALVPGLVAISQFIGGIRYLGPSAPYRVPLDGISFRVD